HSLTDATTDMRLCNALVRDVEEAAVATDVSGPRLAELESRSAATVAVEELCFVYNDELLGHIRRAVDYFDGQVAAHEMSTLGFDSFGKEQIKGLGVSPDAFVQMAMQLAYYRQFRQFPPTYESASTKAFARGRTETSRSVSEHSAAWCRAMVDDPAATSLHDKAEILRRAITQQSQVTAHCAKGSGIDRHLLGLEYALLPGEPVPAIFLDPVFIASRHWKLSTSQISDPILDAYGWGEVVDDGFGIAYRIENDALHFTVVSQRLGAGRLCQYLSDALMDMRFLLSNAHRQPHEIMAEVDAVASALRSIRLQSSSPQRPRSPHAAQDRRSPDHGPAPAGTDTSQAWAPAHDTAGVCAVVGELERLPSSDVICALETRLSRFVKESLRWALPSTS
ncbi:Carnitine O-acetyltransferase mitochondrial, partial [Coemansia spiralis]